LLNGLFERPARVFFCRPSIPDPQAAKDDLVRIMDESGEDYLYHKAHVVFVNFPRAIEKRIRSLEVATV
jgi:hypothetical protein